MMTRPRPICMDCGKMLSDYNEFHDLGECCKHQKVIIKQLLAACKTACMRIGEYYEQEGFDEAPLFKATEALMVVIEEAAVLAANANTVLEEIEK